MQLAARLYGENAAAPKVVFIDLDYDPDECGAILDVAPSFEAALSMLIE